MSDLTVFNFCRVLLNLQGCIIVFNPIQISTSFQLVPSLSFHVSVISLRDKLPASPHPYLFGMILALPQWTSDWLDCWQKQLSIQQVWTPSCLHLVFAPTESQEMMWRLTYLRRSEIVVEEVLTRLWHVLSQMRHLHARRTGRVYLYPCLCLSRFYRRGRLLKKHFNISERTRFGKRKTLTNTVQKIAGGIQCQFSLLLSIWCRPSELCSSANFNGLYSVLHVRHQASTLCVKKEMQRNWACRTNSLWSEHLFWRRTGLSGKTASGFSSVCVCVCSVSQWQTNRQNNRNICESSTRANRQRQER